MKTQSTLTAKVARSLAVKAKQAIVKAYNPLANIESIIQDEVNLGNRIAYVNIPWNDDRPRRIKFVSALSILSNRGFKVSKDAQNQFTIKW